MYYMPITRLIMVELPMQTLLFKEPVQAVTPPFHINTYLPAK